MLELAAQIALDMEVDGHRADIAMIKVAQTLSAYHERAEVTAEDIKEAAELVLPHRMRRKPFQKTKLDHEKLEKTMEKHQEKSHHHTEDKRKENREPKDEGTNTTQPPAGSNSLVFDVGEPFNVKRLVPRPDGVPRSASGRRSKTKTESKSGRYVRSTIPEGKTKDVAFDATLRAAAPYQTNREKNDNAIVIESPDIRQKVRERKIGTTMVFVVDASGSMGANQRMVETKGAILSLLIDAYQKRDKVGLVAFRGNKAEVLLSPTASVELAKKQLEELPTGGRTPLSQGLMVGYQVLSQEMERDRNVKPFLILISDGKANVSMNEANPLEEAKQVAENIRRSGIESMVIDTENSFINFAKTREIAESLGGKYFKMENLKADNLVQVIKATTDSAD